MKKPDEHTIEIYDIGLITTIGVSYTMTSEDTNDSFVVLNGVRFPDHIWSLLDVKPNWGTSIARLKKRYSDYVRSYKKWLIRETSELAEYERLKTKFDSI